MIYYIILGLLLIINIIAIILGAYSLVKREGEYYINEDIVLILTSTVNTGKMNCLALKDPDERLKIYEKAINSWIKDSSFKIVLVENSGYKFENLPKDPRLEIISYTPKGEDKKKIR